MRWLKNADGKKMIAHSYHAYMSYELDLYYNAADSKEAGIFERDVRAWITEHNFYKGEKVTPFGRFLPIPDVKFEDVKMSEEQRTAIRLGAIDFFGKGDFYKKNRLPFKRGIVFAGVPGCLHGNTMIYDPVDSSTLSVKDRYEEGMPFHVLSKDNDGSVIVAKADAPWKYPESEMVKITFESGKSITVTNGHRFWIGRDVEGSDPEGYVAAKHVVERFRSFGDARLPVYCVDGEPLQEFGGVHPASILGPSLLNRMSSDRRSIGINGDWKDHYSSVFESNSFDNPQGYSRTCSPPSNTVRMERVVKAEYAGVHPYYDFHVPVYENYCANGMFHHNTGKTMSGKAIAAQTDKTFIWVNASEFRGIGSLFAMARELAPTILFAEDIDDFLKMYGGVDQLKTEMDGLNSEDGIVTILCTNYPESIPDALIDRPSRFDDVIKFELPNRDTRLEILVSHAKGIDIEDRDNALGDVAGKTEGMTGAHLKEIVVFAMLLAFDAGSQKVTEKELTRAMNKVQRTRDMIGDMRVKEFLFKSSSKVEGKAETLNFSGTTGNVEGEYDGGAHTHAFDLTVERGDDGMVERITGIAKGADEAGHDHPISQMGKTDTVENHYHTFTVDTSGGGGGNEEQPSADDGEEMRSVVVPREVLVDVFEELACEKPDAKKLEGHMLYLESVIGRKGNETETEKLKGLINILRQAKELAESYLDL